MFSHCPDHGFIGLIVMRWILYANQIMIIIHLLYIFAARIWFNFNENFHALRIFAGNHRIIYNNAQRVIIHAAETGYFHYLKF